jgi:hypothetical protein
MMKLLTDFENRQSTRSQRVWVLVWLVLGQLNAPSLVFDHQNMEKQGPVSYPFFTFGMVLLYSVPSIGVFVVVGKMILDDDVCTRI